MVYFTIDRLLIVCLVLSQVNSEVELQLIPNMKPIPRELATEWRSYGDCSSCEQASGWAYFESTCDTDPYRDIFTNYDSMANMGDYCLNTGYNRAIIFADFGSNLEMRQTYSESGDFNNYWYWSINLEYYRDVKLWVTRPNSNDEQIGVEYWNRSGKYFMTPSSLNYWNSNSYFFSFKDIAYMTVRTRALSSQSNYKLELKGGQKIDETLLLIIISIVFYISYVGLVFLIVWLCKYLRILEKERREEAAKTHRHQEAIEKHIEKINSIISSLINTNFSEAINKYEEASCPICLDNFEPDTQVSMIAECEHLFHKECIVEWFQNIEIGHEFKWPNWNWNLEKPFETSEDLIIHNELDVAAAQINSVDDLPPRSARYLVNTFHVFPV